MYRCVRQYRGPLQACILDWSGTTADKYVIAPAEVFRKVFDEKGVPITMAEARRPMGLRKDLHIAAITKMPPVRQRWKEKHGKYPTSVDVSDMFRTFVPMQIDCLPKYSELIPGTREAVNELRDQLGLKIGMTTGFTRDMVDVLLRETKKQGYVPDTTVAGDEVKHGARPAPFMIYKNLDDLNVLPIQSVVKVDDTAGGVGEGISAGCWTIGVSKYSNYMDIDSLEHLETLTHSDLVERNEHSKKILWEAGADFVVDSLVDVPEVVKKINAKLKSS